MAARGYSVNKQERPTPSPPTYRCMVRSSRARCSHRSVANSRAAAKKRSSAISEQADAEPPKPVNAATGSTGPAPQDGVDPSTARVAELLDRRRRMQEELRRIEDHHSDRALDLA